MTVNRPAKIGKYDVIDVIGRGGMGIVYKGSDPYLDRLVAIKMMTGQFADNPDLLKRFFREAQSTASLQHPNIVTVYELGDHRGSPYLVMEYLDGESLDSVISAHRQLTIVEKIELMIAICQGLTYAHQRGIVHRDIKPANIMVCSGGGVKIVDFGIAHFGDKNVTRTGQIVGSINYMSPEQVNGKQVDARTDIFSTGVVLYQLFTYALPFEGESTASTLLKIINEPPPPLKDFLAGYPPQLQTIVDGALAKDRNERYSSAEEFALDLGQLQSQLKQELINRYLQEATQLIETNDLHRAKGQVLQVLKIDRHHTRASHLLRELQEKIQRQEIDEEIQQLRLQAEDAFGQGQFETALGHIERALSRDKENPDLQRLRDTVQAAELRAQKFQRAVRLAESAHQMGDLDSARQTIEEALEITPNDTHARALQRAIQRDWAERTRQRQLENYLEQARREIASRKFTAALELLQQAEALDPAAPQIRTLIESATAAREQERRRRELEAINREIEDALSRDDYDAATEKADEGLKSFPQERSLLKLKALAEKQRQIAKRKRFVDEQLALASSLLEQGRGEELIGRLEAALAKVGGEPRLQSLLLVVRENVEHERLEKRRAEYLQKAKEALRNKQHDEAVRILEVARNDLQDAGEIDDLLQFAKEEAANEKRRQAADAAAEQARRFMAEQEYERAIQLLEKTLQEIPDEELRILLVEARRAVLDDEKKLESALATASKLIESRKAGEAVKLLHAQPASFSKRPAFQKLLETAGKEAERLRQIEEAVQKCRELAAGENYAGAISLLGECRQVHGSTPELEQQLAYVSDELSAAASATMQKALSDARMLLNAAQHRAVLDRLALVSQLLPSVPPALKTEYENVKHQASNGLAYQRTLEIQRHMAAGEITGAAQLLQQTLTEFPGRQDLSELETLINQETASKSEAQSELAEAQTLFHRGLWKRAAELLNHAFSAAQRLPSVREAVLKALMQGAHAAVETDWRAAESLVAQAGELQENYKSPPTLLARIAERKREEVVSQCLEQAKRLQAAGDLRPALGELARGLSTYADDSRLKEFEEIVREQIREQEQRAQGEKELDKANFLHQVNQRAEQETRLDHRTQILEDALTRYPEEPTLEVKLTQVRELRTRVTELANEARVQEDAKHYDEALKQWDALRTVYPQHPDLGPNVERLKMLSEDEHAAKRAAHVRKLESAIASGDLELAGTVLRQAQQEFPGDSQVADFANKIQVALRLRTKAQKLLAPAERAFDKSQWEKGLASLMRGCEAAPEDPIVRKEAIEQLARAFDPAFKADWQSAKILDRLRAAAEAKTQEESRRAQQETQLEIDQTQELSGNLLAARHYDEAIALLAKLQQEHPEDDEAARTVATGRSDQAEQHKLQVLTAARNLLTQRRYDECIDLLTDLKKSFPEEDEIKRFLETAIRDQTEQQKQGKLAEARAFLAAGRFADAQTLLEALRSADPKNPSVQKLLALVQGEQEKQGKRSSAPPGPGPQPSGPGFSKEYAWEVGPPAPISPDVTEANTQTQIAPAQASVHAPVSSGPSVAPPPPPVIEVPLAAKVEPVTPSAPKLGVPPPARPVVTKSSQQPPAEPASPAIARIRRRAPASSAPVVVVRAQKPEEIPLWRRPATLAIGAVVLVMIGGGVHFLSQQKENVVMSPPKLAPVRPPVNPLELRQREAMDAADKRRAAGDLTGASRALQDAALLNGPLNSGIQKKLGAIQAEMKDEKLRKLRQQEEQLWQSAKRDLDRGQFLTAEKYLNDILALPAEGLRRDDAQKYLQQVIPQRKEEETSLARAKRDLQKKDRESLNRAIAVLDHVIQLGGPRRSDAEQLRQTVQDSLGRLDKQRHEQQIASLEASAWQDLKQGSYSSARQKAGQIKQGGGDTASLSAEIEQAEAAEQTRQQYETNYQQTIQNYKQAASANDKSGMEAAHDSFLRIVQGGGSHANDARKYVSEIDDRGTTSPAAAPPPPVAKREIPSTKTLDEAAVREVIKRYEQAFQQRNADAVFEIWQNMGNARYRKLKETFNTLAELHFQVQIESPEVSSSGDKATVNAILLQDSTAKGGERTKPRKDTVSFELAKSNGKWFITDVR